MLLITAVPNIAGLMLAVCYALSAGFLTPAGAITAWLLGGALVSLFLFGYAKTSPHSADKTRCRK